ncbi:MAG: hypothetical protein ACFCUG_02490 [Thiotrichales bacterium]
MRKLPALNLGFLHLGDHYRYRNLAVKKKFADTLISLSDKSFLAILAPALGLALHQHVGAYIAFGVLAVTFFVAGLYFRHAALQIYDQLLETPEKIEGPNGKGL